MPLASIQVARSGGADDTLRGVAAVLMGRGLRLAGVVPQYPFVAEGHPCDQNLIDLKTGGKVAIHQALGTGSRGCRLDAGALEGIVAMVARGMDMERPDLLIVNRFGKLEAAGRGFCPLIVQALEDGVPVVVGVNALNRPSFDAFAGCLAQELPDGIAEVLDWAEQFLDRAAA